NYIPEIFSLNTNILMRLSLAFLLIFLSGFARAQPIQNNKIKPSKAQLAWHDMEFYLFTHFGPNTFTDLEWGKGNEKEEVFNPSQLDCEQWCRITKAAGAKGIIITAKHHDGFCLWPSKYSTHTVKESKWKNGKGDVLKELSAACKKYDLKFGVYLSPWDRNHPAYGTDKYNDVFANMLKEIFSKYGPIWELWWDGANGEEANGKKQVYDFNRFEKLIRNLSPNTIIFSDIGPDIRWVGNENGIAGKTNWNTLDTAGFKRGAGAPPTDTLNTGNIYGKHWIPAECDVSIRPGWFYHKNEDSLIKSPEALFNLYEKSIGRGSCLLLNVPPDGRGLITQYDSAALVDFKKLRDKSFENNFSKKGTGFFVTHNGKRITKKINDSYASTFESITNTQLQSTGIEFHEPQKMNCIALKENLLNGQHCIKFTIRLLNSKRELIKEINGTTIGHKRIISFPITEASVIRLSIDEHKGITNISEIEAYLINKNLVEQ
ncbi:MAG: alpha-L-fucosidase, partial [Ginsengibacter sp.]